MKENKELEKNDLKIEDDILIDDDNPNVLCVYLATYFDVDKKFGLNTADRDDEWLNLYADYDTEHDSLQIHCAVSNDDDEYRDFEYTPTENEASLIKEMIVEEIQKRFGQTPQEYCAELAEDDFTMGGIT